MEDHVTSATYNTNMKTSACGCFTYCSTSPYVTKNISSLKRHKDEPELWRELWYNIFRFQKLSLKEESKEKLFLLLKDKCFDYIDDKVKR